jgi:hypothetical protein
VLDTFSCCVATPWGYCPSLPGRSRFLAGRISRRYPAPLASYAIAQVRDGRKVGNRHSVRDVLSQYAQREKGFSLERLDRYDAEDDQWREIVVEDRRTPPPDQAAFRIDFPAWLGQHSARNRRIAAALAIGYKAGEVAEKYGLSNARVNQLRRVLDALWQEFHGEGGEDLAGFTAVD